MARSRKKLIQVCVIIAVFISLYLVINRRQYDKYLRNPNLKCSYTTDEQNRLLQLAYDVHDILIQLELEHWLMYGSVYGALRYEKPLPWDYDVDFGIRGEMFTAEIKTRIFTMLTAKGISFIDHLGQSGVIWCRRFGAKVDIFLFSEYNDGMMKRQGWEAWLLFLQYRYWHSFPADLVKSPLPSSKFGFFNVSIPHGGVEITKHLYRDDWWKIVKPLRCKRYYH